MCYPYFFRNVNSGSLTTLLLNLGLAGPAAYPYARHSQTMDVPSCPRGHRKLWEGYSLLHTEDDGRAFVQDLGNNGGNTSYSRSIINSWIVLFKL